MINDFEDQIEKLQAQINELKREAERIKNSNPRLAVINARKACEALCRHICIEKGLIKDINDRNENKLSKLIKLIEQKKIADQSLIAEIKLIQHKGNAANHSMDSFNPKDAEAILIALSNFINWYFGVEKSQTPPPEEPKTLLKPEMEGSKIKPSGILKTAKETFKQPWFKTVATSVMVATATALAAKGLNNSKKDENE